MKALAVNEPKKILDLQEFFNTINVSNKRLSEIKESLIQLLKELVKDKIIHNQLEIVLKSGKKRRGFDTIFNRFRYHTTNKIS